MIDVYAAARTFQDPHQLAACLARTLMTIEGVPDIPMFRQNTAGFIHEMDGPAISNVNGETGYVRVQVLTNAGALDREKRLAVVSQFTDLVATAAGDPSLSERTWVLLTEPVEGGWGLDGYPTQTTSWWPRRERRLPNCRLPCLTMGDPIDSEQDTLNRFRITELTPGYWKMVFSNPPMKTSRAMTSGYHGRAEQGYRGHAWR
jgi:phenylpyruvate tautomerase PptA (4-oxalocrotonate tautomerase family)